MKISFFLPSRTALLEFATCTLLGVLIGWWLWHPKAMPTETAAPAITLQGGGLVIKRDPQAPTPPTLVKATAELGKGKLVRTISLDVAPKAASDARCAPAHVDLGVVKMPDNSQRIIVSSANGTITNAVDHPLLTIPAQRDLKWAAGVAYDAIYKRGGIALDRDLGPFRLGADIFKPAANERKPTIVARIEIRF